MKSIEQRRQEHIDKIKMYRMAIALLNSMVESGEKHSDKSRMQIGKVMHVLFNDHFTESITFLTELLIRDDIKHIISDLLISEIEGFSISEAEDLTEKILTAMKERN